MNLEDETGQFRFVGADIPLLGMAHPGRRGNADETVEQFAHAEIVKRTAEKDRSHFAATVAVQIKLRVNPFDQLQVVAQVLGKRCDILIDGRIVQFNVQLHPFGTLLVFGEKQRQPIGIEVVNTFKRGTGADRPRQRTYFDLQFGLDLVEQVERILAGTVEFIDENHHRGLAHTANLHQLTRLGLDTFRTVDHDDHAIDRRQRAVGVFGKILVPRRIEDIDLAILILETHHRGRDRNTPLPLDLHKVRSGSLLDLVRLDGSGHVNRAAEKQQFLGQGGFTRIRVADDGECAPTRDFLL